MKINFGCGSNLLDGWENYDLYPFNSRVKFLDIQQTPLPFENASADFIFCEHCAEHISQQDCYNFLKECFRILKSNGVLRITTPSLPKMIKLLTPEYTEFIKNHGWGGDPIHAILFQHGHKNVMTPEWLISLCEYIGFKSQEVELYKSKYPELCSVEGHHNVIGHAFNFLESFVVESVKL